MRAVANRDRLYRRTDHTTRRQFHGESRGLGRKWFSVVLLVHAGCIVLGILYYARLGPVGHMQRTVKELFLSKELQ